MGRREEPLRAVADDLDEALVVTGDVGSREDCAHAIEEAVAAFGGLDVLVNNAGIGGYDWDRIIDTNLNGAYYMSEAALPHLLERRGSIVNVSSISAYLAGPGWAAYCTSKAGLIMLTRCLAFDHGPAGVRANAVCPGWVRTPMGDEDMDDIARANGITRDEAYELTHRDNPLRRPAEPEEIAAAVSFLAGPDASYVNGVALPVDGGTSVVDPTSTAIPSAP
jgi:NAD(P)-dependent dehydrogenase (short-subunit alcohol dehydrogenase family)